MTRIVGGAEGTGVSTTGLADSSITVFARETSSGPIGHFTIDEMDGHFEVEVNCLSVDGNRAVVGGAIVDGPDIYIGAGYLLMIEDSGNPGSGIPDTVQIARAPYPPGPTFQCGLGGGAPSGGGNFTVHDAQ